MGTIKKDESMINKKNVAIVLAVGLLLSIGFVMSQTIKQSALEAKQGAVQEAPVIDSIAQGLNVNSNYVLVLQKGDYDTLTSLMTGEQQAACVASGWKGSYVFRHADNPHEAILLGEWADMDNARKLYQSEQFMNMVRDAGLNKPDVYYLSTMEYVTPSPKYAAVTPSPKTSEVTP
jgi:hypothetical protein